MSEGEQAWWPLCLQLAGKILVEDLDQARKDSNYKQIFEERFTATRMAKDYVAVYRALLRRPLVPESEANRIMLRPRLKEELN